MSDYWWEQRVADGTYAEAQKRQMTRLEEDTQIAKDVEKMFDLHLYGWQKRLLADVLHHEPLVVYPKRFIGKVTAL